MPPCSAPAATVTPAASPPTRHREHRAGVDWSRRAVAPSGSHAPQGARSMAAIEVRGLRKLYGDVVAVDGIDLTVEEGEVVALLGHDPGSGGRELRERIGIVLQEAGFEDSFTPRELIRLHAGYYPHPRPVEEVVRITGLEDKADARVRTLSGGQRRRLDLALGIVGSPDLLFLDEPTTGFDPSARRRAWDLVEGLRDLGATILLTTHY